MCLPLPYFSLSLWGPRNTRKSLNNDDLTTCGKYYKLYRSVVSNYGFLIGNFLEMQVLRPHSRLNKSETLGWDSAICVWISLRGNSTVILKFENLCYRLIRTRISRVFVFSQRWWVFYEVIIRALGIWSQWL